MIVGCTALFAPIVISRNTLRKEIPLCILSSIVLLICANDVFLDHSSENIISTTDGLLLLCFFIIFLGYTFAIAFQGKKEGETEEEIKQLPMWRSILYIIGGLVALIAGGNFFVDGASGIARNLGVSEYRRTDSGSRRHISARTCNLHCCRLKEESGNCYRKRDWQ